MLLEYTEVTAERSITQLQRLLVNAGARSVELMYDAARRPSGLRFALQLGSREVRFELPVRSDAIYRQLHQQRSRSRGVARSQKVDQMRAERIAWRQIHRWVEAQLALVQLQMAETAEVFMPFALSGRGQTFYREMQEHGLVGLLPAPSA